MEQWISSRFCLLCKGYSLSLLPSLLFLSYHCPPFFAVSILRRVMYMCACDIKFAVCNVRVCI